MEMSHATQEELEQYAEAGFFRRERVFEESELAELREAVDRIHARVVEAVQRGDAGPVERIDDKRYQRVLGSSVQWEWREGVAEIRSMEPYHHLEACLDALIDDPRLWGPARAVVGSEELSLFSDKLNFKRPGGAPFPWHQDSPYWAFSCDHLERLVSVAIHLDDATLENGCLWMIPGSQRSGAFPCFTDRGVVGRLYTDVDRLDLGRPLSLEVPAGSVVFFHGDIVHGSQGNRSRLQRRVLVETYQPAGLPRWQHEDVRNALGA